MDVSSPNLHWGGVIQLADMTTVGSVAFTPLSPNVDHTWSFSWDPNGGSGSGELTVVLDGVTEFIELDATQRAIGANFDGFGIGATAAISSDSSQFADVFIDNVTYSVPEPSTLAFIATASLGGLVHLHRRARRRGSSHGTIAPAVIEPQ